ncbi:MBG domain-containing protein [Imperialibacter roseus]|uniref:MBG domain-containing protein n=1 Tax=Imperialibacter roseus TaxID=1324217 RepID=A0ABZ0IPQ4_9BACT|nr:MBG domain-containing protein [Imperialibacter roseus]WOK07022.1 MBG domain-containing protein [Imperialibacter roseus]
MRKNSTLGNLLIYIVLLVFFSNSQLFGQDASSCGEAVTAVTGVNTIPATEQSEYWYTYIIPNDGKLVVSSSTDLWVNLSYNTCENRYYAGSGIGNASFADATEGEEVFIYWNLESGGGDFEWSIDVVELDEGDNCALAKAVVTGENYVPATYGSYWFSYQMPVDGRIVVETPGLVTFEILHGNCTDDYLYWDASSSSGASVSFEANENVIVRFRVEEGGDFNWTFSVLDLADGDVCDFSTEASVGVNYIPEGSGKIYWFKYTKATEGKIVLDTSPWSTVNAYSGTCDNLELIDSQYRGSSLTDVELGTELYIAVYTRFSTATELVIEESPLEPGDGCNSTSMVIEGTNSLPQTDYYKYWYEFTMPSEGRLDITSETNAYFTVYSGDCDLLSYEIGGYGQVSVTSLSPGEKVWIVWDTGSYDNFDWDLTISELSSGDNCSLAETAVEGINHVPETTLDYYWYTYTIPSTGRLTIMSETDKWVNVQYNNCEQLYGFVSGYGGASKPVFEAGMQLFIKWDTGNGGDFDWSIGIQDFEPGDLCEAPIDAIEGSNTFTTGRYVDQWYRFVMPSNQKLSLISPDQNSSCSIYIGNCVSLYYQSGGSKGASAVGLESGDEVLIRWYGYNTFDWILVLEDYEEGDYCEIAKEAVDGTNVLPDSKNQYFWYKYQATKSGKLVINSNVWKYVDVLSGDCENYYWLTSGYEDLTVPEVSEGDEMMIRWSASPGGFSWDISVEEPQLGDKCTLPATAQIGVNSMPEISSYYWYTFTVEEEGMLSIRSEGEDYVSVLSNNCDYPNTLGSGYGNVDVENVEVGDEVLIKWNYNSGGNFDWALSYKSPADGDICSLAVEAQEGTNSIANTYSFYKWYSFTMPRDGKLTIESDAYADITVYSNSCETLTYRGNYYYGKISVPSLYEGTQILLRWSLGYEEGFDWTLVVEDEAAGDSCDLPETAVVGTNHLPESNLSYFWYSYIAPSAGKLKISREVWGSVNVFTGTCQSLSYYGGGYGSEDLLVPGFNEGDQIFIQWYQASNFDWSLEFSPYEPGDRCTDPLEAVIGTNTTDSAPKWFKFNVPAEGDLTISSMGNTTTDTYLILYQSCGLGSFAYSDDFAGTSQSEITVNSLTKGEEIWILWDDNYGIEGFDWTLTFDSSVEPVDQTITFNEISNKTYGDEFDLVANSDSDQEVLLEVISGPATLAGTTVALIGIGEVTIRASQEGDYYFNPAVSVERSFSVNPARLTLRADNKTITFGDPVPSFTYSLTGFVNGENASVIAGEISVTSEAGDSPTAGQYPIIVSGGSADNYNFTRINGTLTVEKPAQTLLFDELPEKTFGDGAFELSATGGASGNPVTFSSANTSVASIDGNVVTITGGGSTTITAIQAGDENYKDASVERQFIVNKASQTVEFAERNEKIFGDEAFPLSAAASSGLTVSFSSSNTAVAQIENGILNIKSAGEATITALQPGDGNYNLATATQLLVVNKASQAITFSEIGPTVCVSNGALTLSATSSSGLSVSYRVTGPASLLGTVLTLTAPGQVEVTASQGGNINYLPAEDVTIGFEVVDDTEQRAEQTISFSPIEDKTFRDDPFELVATASSGLDITLTIENGPATIDGFVVTLTGAGSVTIAASQAGNEEYVPAPEVTQTFMVGKATATIALSDLQQRADGTPKTPTVVIDPAFVDYVVTFVGESDEPVEPGSYEVVVEVEDNNYQGSVSETFLLLEALGVKHGDLELDIKAYPIPVVDYITIEMAGSTNRNQTAHKVVRLIDLLGRESFRGSFAGDKSTIDLTYHATGIYLLIVESEKGEVLKRVKVRKE